MYVLSFGTSIWNYLCELNCNIAMLYSTGMDMVPGNKWKCLNSNALKDHNKKFNYL